MRALDRKLIRDLRRIWAQSLAIGLVLACGVAVLVMAYGSVRTLEESRDAYYERNRFADVFAEATRAPEALAEEIARIPGVAQVTTRVSDYALLDMPGMAEPGMARVISLPEAGAPALNLPLIVTGRLPDPLRRDEVAVSAPFAEAHGLQPGDRFGAILGGQQRELEVTGTLQSPEFIYATSPGSFLPDDRRFGIFWMGAPAATAAFGLDGAFNDVAVGLSRGASEPEVIAALDRLLEPYGGRGAFGRDDHPSHSFLQHELDQLGALAVILPPVFFVVAAFLVNMVLGRLVALERQQIGLLKAVGYSTGQVATHYVMLGTGIGVAGVAVGWGLGVLMTGGITGLISEYFQLPYLIQTPSTGAFVISGVLGIATVIAGALRAVRATARLAPAVAMSPPAPPAFSHGAVDRLAERLRLRQTTRMIIRAIVRWPGQAAVAFLGVAASVAVLVAAFFLFDAFDVLLDEVFTQSNRQHMTLQLAEAQRTDAVEDARSLPGVLGAEGAYAVPVRLANGQNEILVALEARSEGDALSRVLDQQSRPVPMPPWGLVLPETMAKDLGVAAGDSVTLELMLPPRETLQVPVGRVVRQTMGEDVFMRDEALFTLMRQPPQVNRINLMVDTAQVDALYAAVKATPAINGVVLWSELQAQYTEEIEEILFTMVYVYALLGGMIAVGVIYNTARIRLSERAHELASLRVMGFSRGEVGWVLIGETALLTLAALPLGWLAGYGFAIVTAQGLSTDFATIPAVVTKSTFGLATVIVLIAALGSALVVRRRLDRIELVTALKARE